MPVVKTGRDQWIAASMAFLAAGLSPADVPLADLCAAVKVTKGSFYARFRGLPDLQQAVIGRWLEDRAAVNTAFRVVRNPFDRLRVLRDAAAARAAADSAMRRWAASAPPGAGASEGEKQTRRVLAAAISEADQATRSQLTEALADLRFGAREAAVLAAVLAAALAAGGAAGPPAPADPDAFETLLAVLRRAVPPAPAVEVTGGQDDEVILYLVARDLEPGQLRELRVTAQQFAAGQREVSQQDSPPPDAG